MTEERLVATVAIIFIPLAGAVLAYWFLPSTRFDVAGRLGGFKVDATGALGVFAVLMGVTVTTWYVFRPPEHDRWEIYTLSGTARLPEGFEVSDFRPGAVRFVLSPNAQEVRDANGDGIFEWRISVPVIVNEAGDPLWDHDDWGVEAVTLNHPRRFTDEELNGQLVASGIDPRDPDQFEQGEQNPRRLERTEPVAMRERSVRTLADGGMDGVQETVLKVE